MSTVHQPAPLSPRRAALALPAPSLVRFAMVAVVLVVTGAFTGLWLHLEISGSDYVRTVSTCYSRAAQQTAELPEPAATTTRLVLEEQCRASAERTRAGYMAGGMLVAVLGGLVVVLATPRLKERRRHLTQLAPAAAPIQHRIVQLATECGLRRVPQARSGPRDMSDAFSYGVPGSYRIAVPRQLMVDLRRNPSRFDAVVRHELAHLRHGDIIWWTLAKSIWYVLAPMLAAPVVVAVFGPGRSLVPEYLWRAAAFAIVVHLVVAATLRTREYDADLAAADDTRLLAPLRAAIAQMPRPMEKKWYRRGPLALHPTPDQRLAALDHPERASVVTFTDGLVAGFLVTTAVPLLVELLWTVLTGTRAQPLAQLISAVAAGVLLGSVVGLALTRSVLVCQALPARRTIAAVAFGVGVGIPLGQAVSLAGAGTGRIADVEQPLWLLLSFFLGAGATLVSASVAGLLTDRTRTPRAAWVPAVSASAAACSAAIWIAQHAEFLGDSAGPDWLVSWALTTMQLPVVLPAAAVLTLVTATALVLHRPGQELFAAVVAGIAAGACGALILVVNRIVRGEALTEATQMLRFHTSVWMAAIAAAAVMIVLALLSASRGPALAAVAGPIAVGAVLLGPVAISVAQGLVPSLEVLVILARRGLGLAVMLSLLVAAVAVLGRRTGPIRPITAALASALLMTAAGVVLVSSPELFVPGVLL